jgi:hypothetical protein
MINKFLQKDYPYSMGRFSGFDSEKLYNENLLKQPHDWYYRDKELMYTTNSQGYRTQEFDTIDWGNSIVIFGCSNVYGIGIDDNHTLDKELSKLTKCPVINMGAGGTSIEFSLYNSIILRENYPKPKAVIQIWSSVGRYTLFNDKRDLGILNQGAWNLSKDDKFNTDINLSTRGYLNTLASKHIWDDTIYYEASYFTETINTLKCDVLKKIDLGRDLSHPGIESNKRNALQIYNKLEWT